MTIYLTPEQEQRVQDVLNCGAYNSPEEVVEATIEPCTLPGFKGTKEELKSMLAKGLASKVIAKKSSGILSTESQTPSLQPVEFTPQMLVAPSPGFGSTLARRRGGNRARGLTHIENGVMRNPRGD